MLQVLAACIIRPFFSGTSAWSYSQAPSMVGFSLNRCFIAWFAQEYQCGHGGEAEYRDRISNEFYDGKMADPCLPAQPTTSPPSLIYPEDDHALCFPTACWRGLRTQWRLIITLDCKGCGPN